MRDAVSTGAFLSATLTVGSEILVDEASAPAPPPVFDAGVALAPVLVLLDVVVAELLLLEHDRQQHCHRQRQRRICRRLCL